MRVNQDSQEAVADDAHPRSTPAPTPTSTPTPKRANSRQNVGRPHVAGTKLSTIMRERGIKVHDVGRVLLCSDRQVYNYLIRKYPVPTLHLGALCDRLDTDPDKLVDGQGFLLEDSE